MSMTRKDFQALADIVAEVPGQGCGPEWLATRLAEFCATQNPRFDRDRFMRAAGQPDLARN